MKRKTQTCVNKKDHTYYSNQWAEAGVYRCLDTHWPQKDIVILEKDGILPDPTGGCIARFHRVRRPTAKRVSSKHAKEERGVEGCASRHDSPLDLEVS